VSILPPKRFRPALWIALAFAVIAVLLAIAPSWNLVPKTYDANLAVLTATLVAIICYTYQTYRMVHQERPVAIHIRMCHDKEKRYLLPRFENGAERPLELNVWAQVRVDGEAVDLGEFYSPDEKAWFPILPGERIQGVFHYGDQLQFSGRDSASAVARIRSEMVKARVRCEWKDAHGEAGYSSTRHWLLKLSSGDHSDRPARIRSSSFSVRISVSLTSFVLALPPAPAHTISTSRARARTTTNRIPATRSSTAPPAAVIASCKGGTTKVGLSRRRRIP